MNGCDIRMKILVTGFEPFGNETINPSWEAVRSLPDLRGAELCRLQLPVAFDGCMAPVEESIRQWHPDAILCVGQAGGRFGLTLERTAINLNDARIPDNTGYQPVDQPIRPDGPAAYFATLPVKLMAESIRNAGIPATVSFSAGTFVCNRLMYGVLDLCARSYPGIRAGFMHVPYQHEQVLLKQNTPSLSKEDILRGVTAALEAICRQ